MATAASDGGDEGREHRLLAGEHAHRDPGQRHVAHAVADERHPALDEEDPDERCREAGQQGREQCLAHEVEGEQVAHGATSRGAGSSGAAPMTWPRRGASSSRVVVVGADGVPLEVLRVRSGCPVEVDVPGIQADDAVDDTFEGRELVGDDEHRRATVGESLQDDGQRLLAGVVDTGRRLVHDEHVGPPGERAGDEHAPLLPAGE